MRIILTFTSLFGEPFFGGAEATIFEFYKSLGELDSEIVICTLDKEYIQRDSYNELKNVRIKRFTSFLPHPVLARHKSGSISKIISHFLDLTLGRHPILVLKLYLKHRPDLVITHNLAGWGFFPWIVGRILRVPIIHDNHDFYLGCIKTTKWKPNTGNCIGTCTKCLPRVYATKINWSKGTMITNSNYLQKELKRIIGKRDQTHFETVYPPTKMMMVSARNEESKYDLVYIGRLEESKGILNLLKATEFAKYRIAVGGTGELKDQLEKRFPNVHFLDTVNSFELMAKARILIVPSLLNETFGRIALEGVATGIPVMISSRGALSEFKKREGAILMEFDPENEKDILEKIEMCLDSPRNTNKLESHWLAEHYDDQLSKFRNIVIRNLECFR